MVVSGVKREHDAAMAASEAESRQTTLDGKPIDQRKTRKSYTREYKLEVVHFFRKHDLYQTAKRFSLNTKTVGCWIANEEKIKKSKKVSKQMKFN